LGSLVVYFTAGCGLTAGGANASEAIFSGG
jgi:hypothetical protein